MTDPWLRRWLEQYLPKPDNTRVARPPRPASPTIGPETHASGKGLRRATGKEEAVDAVLRTLASGVPAVGEGMAAHDIKSALERRDYPGAGLTALLGAIPFAGAIKKAAKGAKASRVAELEAKYGSDAAMGVRYSEDEGSLLPDGGRAAICTDCARYVVDQEGSGRVVGWEEGTNKTQRVTAPDGAEGHDFAVLEDRYLVDPWAKNTAGTTKRAVFDLDNPRDRAEVRKLYGDPRKWVKEQGGEWVPEDPAFQAKVAGSRQGATDVWPRTRNAPRGQLKGVVGDSLAAHPNAIPDAVRLVNELRSAMPGAPRIMPRVSAVPEDAGRRFAKVYEGLPVNDPQAKAAYDALNAEVAQQMKAIVDAGYKIEYTTADPYKSSREMLADLRENKRLKVFKTGDDAAHPYMTKEQNDAFRAVHDFIAHGGGGNQFGKVGEENAYRIHAATLSPLAQRALATETRGQNSWVNFGPNSHLPVTERPYAQQKAALWPEDLVGDYDELPPLGPKLVDLEHYSPKAGLTQLDPKFMGSGLPGAEARRADRPPMLHFYTKGTEPEAQFAGLNKYELQVPERDIYTPGKDPATAARLGSDPTENERTILDRGYLGYQNPDYPVVKLGGSLFNIGSPDPMVGVGRLFDYPSLGRDVVPHPQLDLPRETPVTPKAFARYDEAIDRTERSLKSARGRKSLDAGLKVGGDRWYYLDPLRRTFGDWSEEDEAARLWQLWTKTLAATSDNSIWEPNVLRAGALFPHVARGTVDFSKIPRGKGVGLNQYLGPRQGNTAHANYTYSLQRLQQGAPSLSEVPLKKDGFAENLAGNFRPATGDRWFFRLAGWGDERATPVDYLGAEDALQRHAESLARRGDLEVDLALRDPTAPAQSAYWIGDQVTGRGVRSKPRPALFAIEHELQETARQLGISPSEALKRFVTANLWEFGGGTKFPRQ